MDVGQRVVDLPSLVGGDDQAAPAQAGQVVGDVGAGQSELLGDLAGVVRAVQQSDQDPARVGSASARPNRASAASRISHVSMSETVQRELTRI